MTNLKAQKTKAKGVATPIAYKNTQSDSTNNTSHNQVLPSTRAYHLERIKILD